MIEVFVAIVDGQKLLSIFRKSIILDTTVIVDPLLNKMANLLIYLSHATQWVFGCSKSTLKTLE